MPLSNRDYLKDSIYTYNIYNLPLIFKSINKKELSNT